MQDQGANCRQKALFCSLCAHRRYRTGRKRKAEVWQLKEKQFENNCKIFRPTLVSRAFPTIYVCISPELPPEYHRLKRAMVLWHSEINILSKVPHKYGVMVVSVACHKVFNQQMQLRSLASCSSLSIHLGSVVCIRGPRSPGRFVFQYIFSSKKWEWSNKKNRGRP